MGEIIIQNDNKAGHTSIQIKKCSNNDVTDAITSLVTALAKEIMEQALGKNNVATAGKIGTGLPLLLKTAFKVLSEVTERIPDSCLNKLLTDEGIDNAGLRNNKPSPEGEKGNTNGTINNNDRN